MTSQTVKQSKLIAKQLGITGMPSSEQYTTSEEKFDSKTVARAISSVVNYIITDAFNLSDEEHIWLGYQLGKILKPLEFIQPTIILGAVKRELSTGDYSERLFSYSQSQKIQQTVNPSIRKASLEDWTTVISSAILSSYPEARPMVQAAVVGSIYGMLQELGLSNDMEQSRQSMYLPNAVRYALNAKR